MSAAITAILTLLQQLLPLINAGFASSGTVSSIVATLTTWVPLIETLTEDLYTPIKNIITTLQSSGALTDQQITDLKALDAKVDADFEAASAGQDPDAPPA